MFESFAPPAWTEAALCAQVDPELWFPEKGGTTEPAKAVCARCDVKAECLDYALAHGERFGIWGGVSERTRRRIFDAIPDPEAAPLDVTYDTDNDFIQEIA